MAKSTPTPEHAAEQQTEHWKCTACAESWNLVLLNGDGEQRCPECRGPLRRVPSPLPHRHDPAERALVALSNDQQWLVVHWPDARAPWTVLQRLDAIDGYRATGECYEDTGQHAGEILTAFLAMRRERISRALVAIAAD